MIEKYINKVTLLFILLFGAFLRIYQLGKESFSANELMDIFASYEAISVRHLVMKCISVAHFPTHFILVRYWMRLFGMTEFAMRFPSVIFGTASIYIVFLLGKRLFNERTGFLASYFMAASTINIFYSQFARLYSMVVLFVLLSFLFLHKALEENTKFSWFGYIVFTLLALVSSASTLPILISQILFIIIFRSKYTKGVTIKRIIYVFAVILVIYLPLLLILVISNFDHGTIPSFAFLSKPTFDTIKEIFNLFGGKVYQDMVAFNPTRNQALIIFVGIFGVILFLLNLVGIFNIFRINKKEATFPIGKTTLLSVAFLSLWLYLPIISSFIFSHIFTSVFGGVRYFLYTSCAYYLLISNGIMFFRKKVRILLVVFIIFLGCVFLYEYYNMEKIINWKLVCSYIKENIKEDEKTAIIIPAWFIDSPLFYYFSPSFIGIKREEGFRENYVGAPETFKSIPIYSIEDLTFNGIWILYIDPAFIFELQNPPFFMRTYNTMKKLKTKYKLLEEKNFYDITLYHFRKNN